jgi:hypothetical protein
MGDLARGRYFENHKRVPDVKRPGARLQGDVVGESVHIRQLRKGADDARRRDAADRQTIGDQVFPAASTATPVGRVNRTARPVPSTRPGAAPANDENV